MYTNTESHTQTHRETHTQIQIHRHTYTYIHTQTQTHTHTLKKMTDPVNALEVEPHSTGTIAEVFYPGEALDLQVRIVTFLPRALNFAPPGQQG